MLKSLRSIGILREIFAKSCFHFETTLHLLMNYASNGLNFQSCETVWIVWPTTRDQFANPIETFSNINEHPLVLSFCKIGFQFAMQA